MGTYIHERDEWPNFEWDLQKIASKLTTARHHQGRLLGQMISIGFQLQQDSYLDALTEETQKSSEIEGAILDGEQVRSSIARRLGMETGSLAKSDRNIDGIVEMMLDATQNYNQSLTVDRLFGWHSCLFPSGRSGMRKIAVGAWLDDATGPMQVVSGSPGYERVHFEAPSYDRLSKEIDWFLAWINALDNTDPVIRAGISHLWFVTIHPFDDGNGRIARVIADMMLARSENTSNRFYSMSAQINREKKAYYDILEQTQRGSLDITWWLDWFLGCLDRALDQADLTLSSVLARATFWQTHASSSFNDRQRLMLNKLLEGIDGLLTTSKWAKMMKTSQDSAQRDIQDLVDKGILIRGESGGRSTNYRLV
jgi:Fic family protein